MASTIKDSYSTNDACVRNLNDSTKTEPPSDSSAEPAEKGVYRLLDHPWEIRNLILQHLFAHVPSVVVDKPEVVTEVAPEPPTYNLPSTGNNLVLDPLTYVDEEELEAAKEDPEPAEEDPEAWDEEEPETIDPSSVVSIMATCQQLYSECQYVLWHQKKQQKHLFRFTSLSNMKTLITSMGSEARNITDADLELVRPTCPRKMGEYFSLLSKTNIQYLTAASRPFDTEERVTDWREGWRDTSVYVRPESWRWCYKWRRAQLVDFVTTVSECVGDFTGKSPVLLDHVNTYLSAITEPTMRIIPGDEGRLILQLDDYTPVDCLCITTAGCGPAEELMTCAALAHQGDLPNYREREACKKQEIWQERMDYELAFDPTRGTLDGFPMSLWAPDECSGGMEEWAKGGTRELPKRTFLPRRHPLWEC